MYGRWLNGTSLGLGCLGGTGDGSRCDTKLSAESPCGGIYLAPRVALVTHLFHLLSQHYIRSVLTG